MPASLLFVAAEPREFGGLLPFCKTVRKPRWPLDWVRAAEWNSRRVLLAANGAGPARAQRAVEVALADQAIAGVVSTGFCGGLDPAFQIGTVFVATGIQVQAETFPALAPGTEAPHATGVLASIDHIAQTTQEKHRLRVSGASAVEMEAAGVALAASRAGLPFFCVRSVTDLLEESFANDFNAVLRSDGHFATIDLLASAVRRPTVLLPELFRLRKRCIVAARTLGEFLANCRF